MNVWLRGALPGSKNAAQSVWNTLITRAIFGLGLLSMMLVFGAEDLRGQVTIFSESIGAPGGTISLSAHIANNGFDNDGLTFGDAGATDPADVRTSSASSGYTGSSGTGNIFFSGSSGDRGFSIAGINSSNFTNLSLSFGYRKETTTANATFILDWSSDGTNWNTLTVSGLPAEGASTGWTLLSGISLPVGAQASNLRLRWIKSGTVAMRIDDIVLQGTSNDPTLTTSESTISSIYYLESNGPSSPVSFTVTGSSLNGSDVTITAPTNFEVSSAEAGTYGSTVTLASFSGSETTIWTRLATGLSDGEYSGNITVSGGGATSKNIGLTGNVLGKRLNALLQEDFTDSNFSLPWIIGNKDNFSILTDAIIPDGSATTDGAFLGSVANPGQSIVLALSKEVRSWQFSLASSDFAPSGTNYFGVVLMSDTEISGDISSASFNGYYLRIGVNGDFDYVELWRSSGSTKDKVGDFPSSPNFATNGMNAGLNLLITRSSAGVFEAFYSTGFDYSTRPQTSMGTLTNTAHSTSQYFGVYSRFGSARRVYIDNIRLGDATITGTAGWRLLSSAVSNLTLSSFLNPIWTQGATTGANTTDGSPNVYSFNETADNKDAFVSVTDLSATMTAGKGYAVYVFSDDNGPAVEGDAGFPKTLSANGTANSLPFSYSLTFTDYSKIADDGWNFVGNPSTSSLAWSNFARTNVDAPIYLWDDVGNGWKNSLDTTIVPFKGFFVKASASSPELATSASAKEISRITNSVIPKLAIKGSKDNMKTELSVILIDGASIGKDEYDAYALTPLSENYIQSIGVLDSSSFAMISLPLDLSEAFEIPVVLKSTLSGDITLDFSLSDFPQDWSVILRNNDSSEEFDLRSTSGLTHSVTVASKQIPALERMNNGAPVVQKAATDDSEYTIIINPATTTSVEPQLAPKTFALEQNFPNPFNPTTTIRFDVAQSSQITLQVFDVTGRMVETLVSGMMPTGTYSVNWDASAQSSGMYLLRMQTESGILTRKMTLLK